MKLNKRQKLMEVIMKRNIECEKDVINTSSVTFSFLDSTSNLNSQSGSNLNSCV